MSVKQKECKAEGCELLFTPRNAWHKACSWQCAIAYQKEVEVKRIARDKRKAIKCFNANDKSSLTKKAQTWFNKFIRLRDKDKPCISCGHLGGLMLAEGPDGEITYVENKLIRQRQIHASHYRPVGRNARLRFNEFNCHSACSICNTHLSGNLVPYREAMIELYGLAKVEELEADNDPKSYSVEELQEIIDKYKQKIKELS